MWPLKFVVLTFFVLLPAHAAFAAGLTFTSSDLFYVPAAWLKPTGQSNRLSLFLLATSPETSLSKADWVAVPADESDYAARHP